MNEVVIDSELKDLLDDPNECGDRIQTLFETAALSALHVALPVKVDGSKKDERALELLIKRIGEGSANMKDNILQIPDGTSEARAVRIQDIVKKTRLNILLPKSSGAPTPVEQAVQNAIDAVQECVGRFTIHELSDHAQMTLLDLAPKGRTLAVESFVTVPEVEKPKMSFEEKTGDDNLVSSLFTAKAVASESSDVQEEVPEFRWSWTDDELFSERKIPQMRRTTMKESDIEEALLLFVDELLTGFAVWKNVCKQTVSSSAQFTDQQQRLRSRDEYLDALDVAFTAATVEVKNTLLPCIRMCTVWKDVLVVLMKGVQKTMEGYCNVPSVDKPNFSGVVTIFTNLFEKSVAVIPPLLSSKHFSPRSIYYFRTFESKNISKDDLGKALVGCRSRNNEDIESNVRARLSNKYSKNAVAKSNERAAVAKASQVLRQQLEHLNDMTENFTYHAPSELVSFLSLWLEKALLTISTLSPEGLSPQLVAEFKNAASFHLCWNFREIALLDPVHTDADTSDIAYREIVDNFYPEPPVTEPIPETTQQPAEVAKPTLALSSDLLTKAWSRIRDEALSQLQITQGTKVIPIENGIRAQIIVPAKEAGLTAVIRKVAKNGVPRAKEVREYLGAIQAVINVIPPSIDTGKDSVVVPEGLKEHLLSRLDELSQHILPLCSDGDLANAEDKEVHVEFIENPLQAILENARKRREEKGQAGKAGKSQDAPKLIPLDPLHEAIIASDIPLENTGAFISELFATTLERTAERTFRGMVNAHTQPHIEAMNQEMVHFAELCSSTVDRLVLAVVQPGTSPSIGQLNAVATQAMQEILAAEGTYSFLEVTHREAIIRQMCENFTNPDIDPADLVIHELHIVPSAEAASELPSLEIKQLRASGTPRLGRLHATVETLIDQRTRGEKRRATQAAREAFPDIASRLNTVQHSNQQIIAGLLVRAENGDPAAIKILQDYLAFQVTVSQALQSLMNFPE